MSTEPQRTCPSCGNEFGGAMEFCPICVLRGAFPGAVECGASSFEGGVKRTSEQTVQRYEHYELVKGEDGKPVELGRGAMEVTYKAFDVDLHCPVTLKVISERHLGDESSRLRFLREARAAANVRFPNVGSVPQLRVYRNCSKPTAPLEPKEEREAFLTQWDSVQGFLERWEKISAESIAARCSNNRDLQEFEELFRGHFRDFLANEIGQEAERKALKTKVRWKLNPFRGLNFFDFEHAPIFYGRTRAIGRVLEASEVQVRAQRPFVLIVGASSLVRAGVLPLLTQPGTIEGVGLWRWSVTRPGAGGSGGDCFDALAAALLEPSALPGSADPESQNAIRDLGCELREHSDSVALRVWDALDHTARESKIQRCNSLEEKERQLRGSGRLDHADLARQKRERLELPKARLALVIDQLEELFTGGFSLEIRQKYIFALAGLVRSGRVFVLTTLRSDYYASYQEFPDLIELTEPSGKFDLRPPTPCRDRGHDPVTGRNFSCELPVTDPEELEKKLHEM